MGGSAGAGLFTKVFYVCPSLKKGLILSLNQGTWQGGSELSPARKALSSPRHQELNTLKVTTLILLFFINQY